VDSVLALAAVAALVISGILPRIHARADLDKETAEMAIPTVSVVQPSVSTGAGSGFARQRAGLY